MMGWKLTKYSLGARPGGMQPGMSTFRYRVTATTVFLKDGPVPFSTRLQPILCSMKVVSPRVDEFRNVGL